LLTLGLRECYLRFGEKYFELIFMIPEQMTGAASTGLNPFFRDLHVNSYGHSSRRLRAWVESELLTICRRGKSLVDGNTPEPRKACRIQVHESPLDVVLLDQLPGHDSQKPPVAFIAKKPTQRTDRDASGVSAIELPSGRR